MEVGVDAITPTILIHARPATGLEAKFSMPFCAAAALVFGRVGIDTFEADAIANARVRALLPRVDMRVDESLDRAAPPLTQATRARPPEGRPRLRGPRQRRSRLSRETREPRRAGRQVPVVRVAGDAGAQAGKALAALKRDRTAASVRTLTSL